MSELHSALTLLSLVVSSAALLIVLGLAREIGILLARTAPTMAKAAAVGPDVGDIIDVSEIDKASGRTSFDTVPLFDGTGIVTVFTRPTCPACEELLPSLVTFARDYADVLRLSVFSSGQDPIKDDVWSRRLGNVGATYSISPSIHRDWGITGTPFAVLIDGNGVVSAKGVCNTLEQLESLLAIREFVENSASKRLEVGKGGGK